MLTPEEIQSREFLVSLRGYDRDEVHAFLARVAEQVAQTEAKATQLQQRLDRLKSQQPSAAAAAEPSPAAHAASPEPSAVFAEIGKETQRILEAAQEAGQQIQRKARQEADRDLQAARGQAAKLIAEGERRREHIERIVSELEQARAQMSVQLRGVGRTIEQTLRDLGATEGTSTVREAIGAQAGDGGVAVESRREAEPAPAAQPQAEPAPEPPAAASPEPQPQPEPEPEPEPAAEAELEPEPEPAAEPEPEPAAQTEPEQAEQPQASVQPESVDTDTQVAQPAAPAPVADEVNAPGEVPVQPQLTPDTPTEDEVPEAASPTATATATATEPAMAPSEPPSAPSGAGDPQGLRAAALSPLHPKLVRKVKRELQEIQNIALDTVRRTKGQGDVEDFLPDDEDTAGLGEGASELLDQAWQAGVDAAAVLAEREMSDPGEAPDLAGEFLTDAADRVRSGLSTTLRMGLSSDEGAQALSDRIGALFSEFKGSQAEELAATHLIKAYEQGLLGAWSASGVRARRWVLGREPRCPEGRCRYNDQGGEVAVGESFPSGHDVPPVHVGCTCTTVPAEVSSA